MQLTLQFISQFCVLMDEKLILSYLPESMAEQHSNDAHNTCNPRTVLYVYLWVIALLCRWCILALAEFVHGFGVNSNKLSNHLATYNSHCTACNSLISKMGCSASSLVSRSPHSFKIWSALICEKQLNTKECGCKSAILFLVSFFSSC